MDARADIVLYYGFTLFSMLQAVRDSLQAFKKDGAADRLVDRARLASELEHLLGTAEFEARVAQYLGGRPD